MRIEGYSFGNIVIEGKTYTKDVIIFPDRVLSPWWRREGHFLQMADLGEVLKESPGVLVIGKGYSGLMAVPDEVIKGLESMGFIVKVSKTTEAVDIYNASQGRSIAALHLTC